jgi:enoyl-CoA hydratase
MEYQNLLIAESEGIITVTINREKALNALNHDTLTDLEHLFGEDLAQRNDFVGVILTGAGEKAFVAGADIKEFLNMNPEDGEDMSKRGQDIFFLIERFHRPVIAAVNGFALGGGCELAMACHIRIAGERAKFGLPEVNLGLIPGYGGTQRLIQYVGKAKALELMMTTDMLDANEAHRLGLANHVVAAGDEVAKAKEILQKVATKGPIAIEKVIESVNAHFDPLMDGFIAEYESFGAICHSKDFVEGATAFVEKRKANFVGE